MTPWTRLETELDRWLRARRDATLWWRDDDATSNTPALARLLDVAARGHVPVALAVIPAGADRGLTEALGGVRGASVLQHGFAHRNHAPAGEKSSELGGHRPLGAVLDDIGRGRDLLSRLFPGCAEPILVPPWNRIVPSVVPELSSLGLSGLSTFSARRGPFASAGVRQTNAHVDIIDWRGTRGFRGEELAVGDALAHLAARREGAADAAEATGLLTHHLVHDEDCWRFVERFIEVTRAHPAVRWLAAGEALAS